MGHAVLRREGWLINYKKTYRIYCEEELELRRNRPRPRVAAARPTISSLSVLEHGFRGRTLDFSWPGKPTDNSFIESFNGSLRDECLNVHWFLSLGDTRDKIERW